ANAREKEQPELQTPQGQSRGPLIAILLGLFLRTEFFTVGPMLVENGDQRQERDKHDGRKGLKAARPSPRREQQFTKRRKDQNAHARSGIAETNRRGAI